VGCARLLAPVIAANVAALKARAPGSPALARYAAVTALVRGGAGAPPDPAQLPRLLADLVATLPVPTLASLGVAPESFGAIVSNSRQGSMKWNPIELTDDELARALEASL
jgi:alcohol dehydrogenase